MNSPDNPRPLWADISSPREPEKPPMWLFSFTDLTGLLVAFFVLVFSMQVIDRDSWREMSGSFKAAFNPHAAAVSVLPSGKANSIEVVQARKDVLPYLDSLLQSRLGKDAVWKGLRGQAQGTAAARELVYDVPAAVWDVQKQESVQAWSRLAGVVRGWKNPVAVRVVVPEGNDAVRGAALANVLAATLVRAGAVTVAGEVVSGNLTQVQFVVKGE